MKTRSTRYIFPQQKARLTSYLMQNALKFPGWKMIDYQTTITQCNRDHSSSLVLEKLGIKLAPPRGGILWDRCPLQRGSAESTWLFHQPPAPVFQPVPLAAQSSPPSLSAALACAWLVSSSLAIGKARYGSSCFSRAVLRAVQRRGCLPR